MFSHGVPCAWTSLMCLAVSKFPFLIRHSSYWIRAQSHSHVLAWSPYLQTESHSEVLEVGPSTYEFCGDTISLPGPKLQKTISPFPFLITQRLTVFKKKKKNSQALPSVNSNHLLSDFGIYRPGFKSLIQCFPPVRLQASYLVYLGFTVLICTMEITIV